MLLKLETGLKFSNQKHHINPILMTVRLLKIIFLCDSYIVYILTELTDS